MTHNISTYPINQYFSWRCSCSADQAHDEILFRTERDAAVDGILRHAREAEIADFNAKIVELQAQIDGLEATAEDDSVNPYLLGRKELDRLATQRELQ